MAGGDVDDADDEIYDVMVDGTLVNFSDEDLTLVLSLEVVVMGVLCAVTEIGKENSILNIKGRILKRCLK